MAGQSKRALTASLKALKAGTRPATVMHPIATGYSDEQIAALAEFLRAGSDARGATNGLAKRAIIDHMDQRSYQSFYASEYHRWRQCIRTAKVTIEQ